MDDWKEHPNLFANGRFRVKTAFENSIKVIGAEVFLTTNDEQTAPKDEWKLLLDNNRKRHVDDCTLIARPIEDMTNEEFEGLSFVNECIERQFFINLLKSRTDNDNLRFDDSRHLLSIGVYPFDQSHFGDTVIDVRTLTE